MRAWAFALALVWAAPAAAADRCAEEMRLAIELLGLGGLIYGLEAEDLGDGRCRTIEPAEDFPVFEWRAERTGTGLALEVSLLPVPHPVSPEAPPLSGHLRLENDFDSGVLSVATAYFGVGPEDGFQVSFEARNVRLSSVAMAQVSMTSLTTREVRLSFVSAGPFAESWLVPLMVDDINVDPAELDNMRAEVLSEISQIPSTLLAPGAQENLRRFVSDWPGRTGRLDVVMRSDPPVRAMSGLRYLLFAEVLPDGARPEAFLGDTTMGIHWAPE